MKYNSTITVTNRDRETLEDFWNCAYLVGLNDSEDIVSLLKAIIDGRKSSYAIGECEIIYVNADN